jgi:hypothetical protein
MARTLTVAVLGDPEHAFENYSLAMPQENLDRPFDERLKLAVEAEDHETLIAVLGRAARQLGITEMPWGDPVEKGIAFCGFYKDEDRDGWDRKLDTEVTLVGDEGHAQWGVQFKSDQVTIEQLLGAGEQGALNGDPLRPYLILSPSVGNGFFLPWVVLGGGLKLLWDVMQTISTVEDTLSFGQRTIEAARGRLGRGREVVEEHYTDWSQRGGTPVGFMAFLGQRPWATPDLAQLLGCTEQEAEAVLWAFGYTKAESGLWRPGGDSEAELLRTAVGDLPYSFTNDMAGFERTLQARIGGLLRDGELPPEPTDDFDEDDLREEEDVVVDLEVTWECACGQEDCHITVKLQRTMLAGDDSLQTRLRLAYEDPADHFVFNLPELGTLLGALAAGA